MPLDSFARAVLPSLLAEAAVFAVASALPASRQVALGMLTAASVALLPAVAGFRVARAGGHRPIACLGGVAVSAVTLLCAAVTQLFPPTDWAAFLGFVVATVVISVPLQALFGFIGSWLWSPHS